jgi:hypothetical protein
MISIKMFQGKFRILVGEEVWEFENVKDMKFVLETLIDLKDKYGRIKN